MKSGNIISNGLNTLDCQKIKNTQTQTQKCFKNVCFTNTDAENRAVLTRGEWASLVAQVGRDLPAVQETWV